jgi:hypothetical protein
VDPDLVIVVVAAVVAVSVVVIVVSSCGGCGLKLYGSSHQTTIGVTG